jgi:glycerol kinase
VKKKYILSIDQGTTGSRVILFNHEGEAFATSYKEIVQYFPYPGWVEHDPMEYISCIKECSKDVMEKTGIGTEQIAAIGITNQRETIILWDKETGRPVCNAIVWQCRRSAAICDEIKAAGYEKVIREKTGLVIDAYFSASKIKWIIDNMPGVKEDIGRGRILAGTVDSWLIWNLSGKKYHVTDYSNASRTMLFNIHTLKWDDELLEIFGINKNILPQVKETSGVMAYSDKADFLGKEVPFSGVAGDQHAALFGQACYRPGMTKNTYGTGLAIMMNTGDKAVTSKNGLTTDLAWVIDHKPCYALEGVIFMGGSTIQWLRDGLKIINDAAECDILSKTVPDTGNVYLVPAFTGLCAPYWDMYARGVIIGITRGTSREHICRAALEAIAYQTRDVIDCMIADSEVDLALLRVDGGAVKSDFLMQFQSDILGIPIELSRVSEMAALGAAYLAGLGVGYWEDMKDLEGNHAAGKRYEPKMTEEKRELLYSGWKEAVKRSFDWEKISSG